MIKLAKISYNAKLSTLFVLILLIGFIGTLNIVNTGSEKEDNKLFIVTTTGMLGDAIKNIGSDKVKVKALMGPGIDPHLYTAKAKDLVDIYDADIIIYNGLHLEASMSKVFAGIQNKKSFAVGDYLPREVLIENFAFSEYPDPHIWFDVSIWQRIITVIYTILIEADPLNQDYYTSNYNTYLDKLSDLDNYIISKVQELNQSKRILVTAHDAFSYFGKRYNFTVLGLQGISTATQAGSADVSNLANIIVKNKIKAIFVETSVSQQSIDAVRENCLNQEWNVNIGGNLYSDAMGDAGTFEGTYIGMFTINIDTIVNGLK